MVVDGSLEGTPIKYRREYRKCGKSGCELCASGNGHGPYWYAYWTEDGRRRRRSLGSSLPEGVSVPEDAPPSAESPPVPAEPAEGQSAGNDDEIAGDAALRVRTLGGFAVNAGGRDISPALWAEQPRVALLFGCLLRAPGHRLDREDAEAALWPDERRGAHTRDLIEVVRGLRLTLDGSGVPAAHGYVRVGADITLAPGLGVDPPADWLDDLAFEVAARGALAGDQLTLCLEAAARYTGDYLPGEGYHDPAINGRREHLKTLHVAVLTHLAELCMRQTVSALQRVLRHDETDQRAVRLLMRQFAALGARGPALAVYRKLEQVLGRTGSGQPEPETLAIQESLLRNMGYLPVPAHDLIGRDGVLAALAARLQP